MNRLRILFGAKWFRVLSIDRHADHQLSDRMSIYAAVRTARNVGGDIIFSPTTA